MRSNHRVRKMSLRRTISAALPLFLIVASFVTPLAAAQAAGLADGSDDRERQGRLRARRARDADRHGVDRRHDGQHRGQRHAREIVAAHRRCSRRRWEHHRLLQSPRPLRLRLRRDRERHRQRASRRPPSPTPSPPTTNTGRTTTRSGPTGPSSSRTPPTRKARSFPTSTTLRVDSRRRPLIASGSSSTTSGIRRTSAASRGSIHTTQMRPLLPSSDRCLPWTLRFPLALGRAASTR